MDRVEDARNYSSNSMHHSAKNVTVWYCHCDYLKIAILLISVQTAFEMCCCFIAFSFNNCCTDIMHVVFIKLVVTEVSSDKLLSMHAAPICCTSCTFHHHCRYCALSLHVLCAYSTFGHHLHPQATLMSNFVCRALDC